MEKKKVNRNICFMISGKCTKIDQGTMLQTLIVTWYFCCWNIQTIPSFYVYNFLCIYVFWAGNCKLPMILFSAIIKKCLPKVTFSMYFKWLFSIYIRKRSHWNHHVCSRRCCHECKHEWSISVDENFASSLYIKLHLMIFSF